MSDGYTRGPWFWDGTMLQASRGPQKSSLNVLIAVDCKGNPVQANARLIAAAPDLYEALRSLIALMDRDARANDTNYAEIVLEEPEVEAARAAIAKATAQSGEA